MAGYVATSTCFRFAMPGSGVNSVQLVLRPTGKCRKSKTGEAPSSDGQSTDNGLWAEMSGWTGVLDFCRNEMSTEPLSCLHACLCFVDGNLEALAGGRRRAVAQMTVWALQGGLCLCRGPAIGKLARVLEGVTGWTTTTSPSCKPPPLAQDVDTEVCGRRRVAEATVFASPARCVAFVDDAVLGCRRQAIGPMTAALR